MNRLLSLIFLTSFIMISSSGCAAPIDSMDDPRVDVNSFRFEDYGHWGIRDFVKTKFPNGTTKEYVDSILIGKGSAKETGRRHNKPDVGLSEVIYKYEYNDILKCTRSIVIIYDKEDKVAGDARFFGGCL